MIDAVTQSEPLRDQIADILRRRILTGEMPKDYVINERALSEEFNVSTTPVKEALRMINAEGLVRTIPRKCTVVTDASESLVTLTDIRAGLEGVAARRAASNKDDVLCAQLREQLEVIRQFKDAGDYEKMKENDGILHEMIRKAAHSDYLRGMLKQIREFDSYVRMHIREMGKEEWDIDFSEHSGICEAIIRGDEDEAERRMAQHIREGMKRVIKSR